VLAYTSFTEIYRGNCAEQNALVDELIALADEKATLFWKGCRNDDSRPPVIDLGGSAEKSASRKSLVGCDVVCVEVKIFNLFGEVI
jgi:hypothetical protein